MIKKVNQQFDFLFVVKVGLSQFSWCQNLVLIISFIPATKNLRRSKQKIFIKENFECFDLGKFLVAEMKEIISIKVWHHFNNKFLQGIRVKETKNSN